MKQSARSKTSDHRCERDRLSVFALLASFSLGCLASAAHAAPVLPTVSYSIFTSVVDTIPIQVPGSYSGEWCSPSDGSCASASASATPDQVVTASGASAGTDNLGAVASSGAQITYGYSVNGPANLTVPLRITGLIDLSVQGPSTWMLGRIWYTTASNPNGVTFQACASDSLFVCQVNNVHLDHSSTSSIQRTLSNLPYFVTANSLQTVNLAISGVSNPGGGPGGRYNGLVDPVITIDPAFLAANPGYSLSFSEGLQVVPAPGALVLLGTALGALAVRVMRRRLA